MAEDKTNNDVEEIEDDEDFEEEIEDKNDRYDDEELIYHLEYDDGEIMDAETQGIFQVGDKEYIALIPLNDSDDVYIYGFEDDPKVEGGRLIDILDDKEFEAAVAEYDRIINGE